MKAVNTPEKTVEERKNNNDKEFVASLHRKHSLQVQDLAEPGHTIQWCPGCGDFGILLAIKKAIIDSNIDPDKTVIVSGIGCSGKLPHYIKLYGVETLHGRALPVATGVKLANKALHVIVVGGDGDGYGLGIGHLMHTMRRNVNLTYVVHNNEIYGLTKGQTSPTSVKGTKSVSTPNGAIETPVNPIALGLTGGATFVARSYAGDTQNLSKTISQGIQHRGFSLIDVGQPCVSYNPRMSYQWYQERVYTIEELKDYNPQDKTWAMIKALEDQEEKIPIGIFYKEDRETYIDHLPEDDSASLVSQDISNIDVESLLDKYE